MITDYTMYTLTDIVLPLFSHDFSKYGSGTDSEEALQINDHEMYTLHITGDSSFANIIRSLSDMLNPLKDVVLSVDATVCRPTPNPPDFNRYIQIGSLLLLAFVSIVLQVYIMRLRHVIMIWFYPKKAVHRAAWLRTYIKNNRGLYHRIIHKFVTMDIKPNRRAQNISRFGKYLSLHPYVAALFRIFGIQRIMCVFCGSDGNPSKKVEFQEKFTRCQQCGAHFCHACQVTLNRMCLLCRSPLFSMAVEVDFEECSSDEEFQAINTRYLRLVDQSTTISSKNKMEDETSSLSITRSHI
ncbi:unnamed protein product [Heterobilharzia americana]|nr:unnamed protein product [Heterobilharzia americana]